MSDVIDLSKARDARNPHLAGEAKCIDCQHVWSAVAPIGTVWLDCPSCASLKGRFTGAVLRDGKHLACECDNDMFYIRGGIAYCARCGEIYEKQPPSGWQSFVELTLEDKFRYLFDKVNNNE